MPFQLSPAEEMARKIAQEYTEREIIPRRKELMIDDRAMWKEQAVKQNKFGFHLHIVPRAGRRHRHRLCRQHRLDRRALRRMA